MDEQIKIQGYHGTTRDAAVNIVNTQKIEDSIGNEEWLGRGKYFYDRYTNALEYIIKKYKENKKMDKEISYDKLMEYYCILTVNIEYGKKDILDLDEIVTLSKFLWMWEKIYEKVKDDDEFKKIEFRDGYMIDYMNEIFHYKIVMKTFDRFIRKKNYRKKKNKIFDETRISHEFKQRYICVKDENCLSDINIDIKESEEIYNNIKNLDEMLNRRGYYETGR